MAQIILTENEQITIEESTQELFDLLLNDKQFIIVNIKYAVYDNYGLTNPTNRMERVQIAINKKDIAQAF